MHPSLEARRAYEQFVYDVTTDWRWRLASTQLLSPLSPYCLLRTTLWSLFISPLCWDHSRVWASLSLRSKKGGHVSFPYWRQRHARMYACPKHSKKRKELINSVTSAFWGKQWFLFYFMLLFIRSPLHKCSGIRTAVLIATGTMNAFGIQIKHWAPSSGKNGYI